MFFECTSPKVCLSLSLSFSRWVVKHNNNNNNLYKDETKTIRNEKNQVKDEVEGIIVTNNNTYQQRNISK